MSAKHTTGLRARDDARISCGDGADYRCIGTAYGWDREFEYDEAGNLINCPQSNEEAIANARLWAAAPELLEALQEIVDLFDSHDDCEEIEATSAARNRARELIAKATGSAA